MAPAAAEDDVTQRALRARKLATTEPANALPDAQVVSAFARRERNAEALSIAEHAAGIAARTLGDITAAIRHLEMSVRIADRAGLQGQSASARVSLAPALHMAGRTKRAIRILESAISSLSSKEAPRATVQLASLHIVTGNPEEIIRLLKRTVPTLRRRGDSLWYARGLAARGVAQTRLGLFAAADADFAEAERVFSSQGDTYDAAGMRQNRGWTAAYAGDVPEALAHYDSAEAAFAAIGLPPSADLPIDRANVLLHAGLAEEARGLAEQTAETLAVTGQLGYRADVLLLSSNAALACGDSEGALTAAHEARRLFARLGRHGWTAMAGYAAVRARWGSGDRSASALRLACATADELSAAKLSSPALDARLIAGRTALELNRASEARRQLALVSAARARGPAVERSRGWMAEALLRIEDGRPPSALRALRTGLDVIDRHRATLGATELRAHASGHATDLATLGQRLAIESGRAAAVLEWTERWRGAALRLPPVRPADDAELAADLASLRDAHTELQKAEADGAPTAALKRRRNSLEEAVLRRTRRASSADRATDAIATKGDLTAALEHRALVEIAAIDDRIVGLTLVDGRLRLHSLGDVPTVRAELDSLRFCLRRLAFARSSSASIAGARTSIAHSAAQLDDLLLTPLVGEVGDRSLVVVPPGGLHTLPWSLLPSCTDRDVSIAPSATTWLRCAQSRPPRTTRVALVSGPGLAGADEEVAALGRTHRGSIVLSGSAATADATSTALDGASLAHVAAHGTFRSDNPLFSSLQLADGPLTVYDLERLRRAPYRLILSSCDSGLAGVRAGDELMGLAAAMFPLGTAGIVASVVPVPDSATLPLMLALHDRLLAGASLSQGLAAARATLDADDPVQFAAGAAFIALGAR